MPNYDYKCSKCGSIKEVTHRMSEEPKVECDKCESVMSKIPSIPNHNFVGEWFKTKGKY